MIDNILTPEQIKEEVYSSYLQKFKNRLYGLLREKERHREWEKFLDTLLIELYGFPENARSINYYALYYKISSLRYLDYEYFRKTVFECMNLVDDLRGAGDLNELF